MRTWSRLASLLREAAAAGLAAREALAAQAAAAGKVPLEVVRRFLVDQTRYAFGPKELQGLAVFLEVAGAEGLAPEGVRLQLAGKETEETGS